ncbi:MAG: helix-turn-helix transcriptional regulator [Bacteroidota bacterium]
MNNGQYLIEIGKKIRATRKAKGINQPQLVKLASVHKSSLSEIENGLMNIKILSLKKLADALEVDVKDFL